MKKVFLVMALAVLAVACMRLPQVPTLDEFSLPVAGEKTEWISTDYEGKPVLIVFMGSWCPYCKMSMPFIDAANENFGGQVEIVSAFLDDDPADVAKVVKEHNFKTKALYNASNIAESMEVSGLPHVVVFDKKHNAVKMWEGFSPELGQEIHDYLKKVSK
ncbi:TlpA family protein disulfide reductase [Candidatus Avelusimicrobium stercoris]|uniref:TlpA family protein disulfide reductase n=1 Tax=Candidatus Avelusimicrobium stercoris TaxID=1947924 RepID=UPI003D0EC899